MNPFASKLSVYSNSTTATCRINQKPHLRPENGIIPEKEPHSYSVSEQAIGQHYAKPPDGHCTRSTLDGLAFLSDGTALLNLADVVRGEGDFAGIVAEVGCDCSDSFSGFDGDCG